MPGQVVEFEVAVIGGGPAGSALAWRLARAGVATALIDDGHRRGPVPRETLLAAARRGLERSGMWDLVAPAARPDPLRHGAIWGGPELVWRDDGEPGLLLDRGLFDVALRAAAVRSGVVAFRDSYVAQALPAEGRGEFSVLRGGNHRLRCKAERFVVATGNHVPHQMLPTRLAARGPQTAALSLEIDSVDAATWALVEAVPQGWWWWIGDGRRGGAATLLCDAAELRSVGTREMVRAATKAAVGPVARVLWPGDEQVDYAGRATAQLREAPQRVLLIGDAASTVDPLASQGVEKALAAADHAAAVLLTAREHPEWWPRLVGVHAGWERGLFEAHAATTRAFLARETRFGDQPFWRARQPAQPSAAEPAAHGLVFPAADLVAQPVLVREGDRFVEREGVRDPRTGDERTHVGFVPIVPVLRAFDPPRSLADGVAAAGRDARLFVLPPRAVHDAATELLRRGWLRPAYGRAGSP